MPNNPDYSGMTLALDEPGGIEQLQEIRNKFYRAQNYTPPTMNTDQMRDLVDAGFSPEAAAMVARFVAAGMEPDLAVTAVNKYMGMNSKGPTPEEEWDAYEKANPIKANTKKLLTHGGRALKGAAGVLASPIKQQDAEKISAHQLLKQYLMAQDQQRMNESNKAGLWMLARMPGAPLSGQPLYMGPQLEGPVAPLPVPGNKQANNLILPGELAKTPR